MAPRTRVRDALAGLQEEVAELTGEGAAVTVVLVEPTPEFPSGCRARTNSAGRVVEIVCAGGDLESGLRLTAPLPQNVGKIIAGVDPMDLV